jgi:hypothetical protein
VTLHQQGTIRNLYSQSFPVVLDLEVTDDGHLSGFANFYGDVRPDGFPLGNKFSIITDDPRGSVVQEFLHLTVRFVHAQTAQVQGSYYEVWPRLGYYPSLLLFYAGGIAAVAAKKYDTFAALAWRPVIRTGLRGKPGPLAASVNTGNVLSAKDAQFFNPGQSLKTPTSEHLFSALRQRFSELLPDDVEYQRAFDEFEYLVCLTFMHASRKNETFPSWPPIGSFVWRHALDAHRLIDDLSRDAEEFANDWPPLKAGLFDGSIESFKAVRDELLSSELFRQLAF